MMQSAANSVFGPRLRRKSAALMLTNELRRSSRVSTCSFEQATQMIGPDGLTFLGVNLVPFGNGFRYNLPVSSANIASSRKTSLFIGPSSRKPSAFFVQKSLEKELIKKEKTRFQRMTEVLLSIYEKSRVHYLLPILVLVIYSFLGGAIFYTIEHPAEQNMLIRKKEMVDREEIQILAEVQLVEQRIREMTGHYNLANSQNRDRLETFASISTLKKEMRKYRQFAMNRIRKTIYWYVLLVYFLTDQETYKSSLLHPKNPERHWRSHFQLSPSESSIGRIVALKNYTEQLAERCWELGVELNSTDHKKTKLTKSIREFNEFVGLQHTLAPSWTFWNSMFLAVTTYSTIGYGNITPKTNLGKLAAMVYAAIGIPMTFMVLHKLGRFFLLCFEHFWNKLIWFMEFVSCVKDAEKLKGKVRGTGRMPVLLAIGVAFAWMFLCAAIFLKFEKDWDYFKSFYFFFCSLTTIGYGDVTPTNSEDMFIIFGFIIVGLSLVSMCINVIQLKLEELFEELLLTMMEEYVEAGGPTVEEITATMKPKMSMVDLWKVWQRRRQRRNQSTDLGEMAPGDDAPQQKQFKQNNRRMSAGKAECAARQWPNIALSEGNLRRVIKLFPFGRRRREAILRRLQMRMNQYSKATQTDFCCAHGFRYQPTAHSLLNQNSNELVEEETLTESSEHNSFVRHPTEQNPMGRRSREEGNSMGRDGSNESADSSAKNVRLAIASSSLTSSPVALTVSSSATVGAPFVRRFLPSHCQQNVRRVTASSLSASPSSSSHTHCSVHSTPIPASGQWEQHSDRRRWTFFEAAKTPRGEPRGLVVPYMYTRKMAKTHETDEMRRLIAEIDSRLLDCPLLVFLPFIHFVNCQFDSPHRFCFCKVGEAIDSCECDSNSIDVFNNAKIYPALQNILQKEPFKFYKVNMAKPCPFWEDEAGQCSSKECSIGYCDDEVPPALREPIAPLSASNSNDSCGGSESNKFDPLDDSLSEFDRAQLRELDMFEDNSNKFCEVEDENPERMHYVNLAKNPERYTGYKGNSAVKVWKCIYNENCFKPDPKFDKKFLLQPTPTGMCLEKRVFYRLISGLHSAITVSIAAHNYRPAPGGFGTGTWYRNVEFFENRFGTKWGKEGPERLRNLYFTYMLELRALIKATPYIRKSQLFYTGNEQEDRETQQSLEHFLAVLKEFPNQFDETQLFSNFQESHARLLKEEFRQHFWNISRIMDCVGCDKCRLWGKLQTHGMGTALKVLFSDLPRNGNGGKANGRKEQTENGESAANGGLFKLTRNDLVALFQSFGRYSSSIWEIDGFRKEFRHEEL
ncbi:hypothetical protein niasHS_014710 [Heterodera schachtii]|uniref:Potassium channel domain-containing protein n=1 Tax=Heterodera schachtii TaxID=97005 RepID=A0ABD2IHU0_HETSC